MRNQIEIRPEYSVFSGYVYLHLIQKPIPGEDREKRRVVTALTIEETNYYEMQKEPPLALSYIEAQALMDNLWHIGLRPTEGKGTAGLTEAMKEHIIDLRKMAFGTATK